MATEFMTQGAGCVVQLGKKGTPFYRVEGWDMVSDAADGSLVTIESIDVTESDIAVPVVALDGYRVLYRFGEAFGNVRVNGIIHLGPVGKQQASSIIGKVSKAFKDLRLSSNKTPKNVSFADGYKCKVYFVGLAFGQADPEFNALVYAMSGILAPYGSEQK